MKKNNGTFSIIVDGKTIKAKDVKILLPETGDRPEIEIALDANGEKYVIKYPGGAEIKDGQTFDDLFARLHSDVYDVATPFGVSGANPDADELVCELCQRPLEIESSIKLKNGLRICIPCNEETQA